MFPHDESNRKGVRDAYVCRTKDEAKGIGTKGSRGIQEARGGGSHDAQDGFAIEYQATLAIGNTGSMRAMLKSELAAAAGVSRATFRRWLQSDADYMQEQGVKATAKMLPPKVVNYLIEKYCIEM